jgi:PIN domain nuclease of toxin-antitoxin system
VELLLDTHAFLWWLGDDPKLGVNARAAIADAANAVYVSAASAWEIAVKRATGRLEAPGDIRAWIADNSFAELPIAVGHAIASAELPRHHADPFDRLLVAQAMIESLVLVAHDGEISRYGTAMLDARA